MGAYCNGNVSLSPSYDVASAQDPRLRELKQLGYVLWHFEVLFSANVVHVAANVVHVAAIAVVDMSTIHVYSKTGFTNMVYPGAVHSRFEHSLGVYWLASQCVEKLKTYQGLELGIDRFDIQTVKLAVDMVDYIVDEHHIDVYPQMIRRVKEMILASSEYAPSMSSSEKSFLYDIVANGRNGIDVDKFDYLLRDCRACGLGCNFEFQRLLETMRVLDDEICYRAKDYLTIHKMFATRADLYRTVYTHPKVKAIELMVVDALVHANSYLGISSNIHDPSEYWKFCNEYPVPKDMLDNYKKVTAQDIVCSQKSGGVTLKEEDVAVCNVKIDLTRGKHNPLESIHFFKDYESDEKFTIPDDRVSHLLPTSYQDMIVKVYAKKPELVEAISEAFENFQLKTYGIKTQAHSTPQKKRRYNSFI
ncbi:hypothetical protein JHK84_036939 [Glycine max]|nr:hypothetical protein JHK84_036939 [Glycine max]